MVCLDGYATEQQLILVLLSRDRDSSCLVTCYQLWLADLLMSLLKTQLKTQWAYSLPETLFLVFQGITNASVQGTDEMLPLGSMHLLFETN